jgi:type I restriction enzyme S subunit
MRVLSFGDGYRTKKSELGRPGIPILRVAEVHNGYIRPGFTDYVSNHFRGAIGNKISQSGDIVLTTKGTVGRVAIIPEGASEFTYSPQVCYFRVRSNDLLAPRFLYYWFKSPEFWSQAQRRKSQTDMADYLNMADIRSLSLTLPHRDQQEAIVDVLGALDDKIAINERIATTADELANTHFKERFSPALNYVADGTPLPPEWAISTIGSSTTTVETGARPKGGVSQYTSGVPSIGAESIIGLGQFDFTKTKFVPEEFFTSMRRGVIQDRDILVYKDGGRPGDFKPHVTMFGSGFPFSKMCINEHVYRVRMASNIGQEFGYYWLSSTPLMAEMRRRGTGAAIPGINSTAFKEIPLVIPPSSNLASFVDVASPLVDKVLMAAIESRTLSTLRDTLLPQLMSGRLRVKDAEKIVEDHA